MAPSTIQTWLLGGIGLLSVSFLCYFMFWRKPAVPAIKDSKETPSRPAAPKEESAKKQPEVVKKVESKPSQEFVVEDAEDDEDEEEAEEEEANGVEDAELEALKTKYEDANRLATKYINGQMHAKAIEKLTEALELAPKIPNASKDIATLYNNRSAMYEKMEAYDKSLSDITVLLAMDTNHLKARVRRARIYEAQGKMKLALDDYIYGGLLQQIKQEQPSNQQKVESIVKELAQKSAPALFASLRAASTLRELPSKSHCKNFLESYPSMYMWLPRYRTVSRETLVNALQEAKNVPEAIETESPAAGVASPITEGADRELLIRQRTLDLVCHDLVNNRFSEAFALLTELPLPAESTAAATLDASVPLTFLTPFEDAHRSNAAILSSLQYELVGFNKHLRCDLSGAVEAYKQAIAHYPNNVDAWLKLANVYLEVPDLVACSATYATLLAFLDAQSVGDEAVVVMKAWTLLHRVSVYVTRNEKGEYSPTAIADAQRDVDAALALAEKWQHTSAGKAAMVSALQRSVHVIMQSKPTVGEAPTEEDGERCKASIEKAKAIHPNNDSVLLMEMEIVNNEGRTEDALEIINTVQRLPHAIKNDCTLYCLRASVLVNKAMLHMQVGDFAAAQELFSTSSSLYMQGLALEPNAIELLNQYAQFSSMIGDVATAVKLIKTALPLARTRDDVQDLNQLLIMNEAQLRAVDAIRATQMRA